MQSATVYSPKQHLDRAENLEVTLFKWREISKYRLKSVWFISQYKLVLRRRIWLRKPRQSKYGGIFFYQHFVPIHAIRAVLWKQLKIIYREKVFIQSMPGSTDRNLGYTWVMKQRMTVVILTNTEFPSPLLHGKPLDFSMQIHTEVIFKSCVIYTFNINFSEVINIKK